MCLRIVCAWLRHAFIRRHLSRWWRWPRRRATDQDWHIKLQLQLQLQCCHGLSLPPSTSTGSVLHDLFLLCRSDNSNAIRVSHRLYLLDVSFLCYFCIFFSYLCYFWHAAKLPDRLVRCIQFAMHKQISGFSCSSLSRRRLFCVLSKQISLIILHKLCARN